MSIQQSNNYFWETYTGKEGEEFFTDKMKNKYFDKAVDLKYIQDMKIVSKGNIEKFTNINASIPSISFITYREITDKNTTTKFRTEMTYKFTFTGYHWLIDNVTFERLQGVYKIYTKEQVKIAIINCLDDKEALIFKARHGIDNDTSLTIEQILMKFEIDINKFRQIEAKVLAYLNKNK